MLQPIHPWVDKLDPSGLRPAQVREVIQFQALRADGLELLPRAPRHQKGAAGAQTIWYAPCAIQLSTVKPVRMLLEVSVIARIPTHETALKAGCVRCVQGAMIHRDQSGRHDTGIPPRKDNGVPRDLKQPRHSEHNPQVHGDQVRVSPNDPLP